MARSAKLGKQLVVTAVNKVGVLAEISKMAAEANINIEAVAGYSVAGEAKIAILTAGNVRITEALKKSGYKNIKEEDVMVLELDNRPGVLKDVCAKLAEDGVDIKLIYGSVCATGCPSKLVFSVDNAQRALNSIK